jgi:6-pyruvoyltetrahydropterin/6-carboxytetrahydropterin synthase
VDRARLIRTLRFRARHHYLRGDWSEAENRRVFGAQTEPHEHDWTVEVHVTGPIDADTGWVVDLGALDAALADITDGWNGGDLNVLVPDVAAGRVLPSTEGLARWLHGALGGRVPAPARLERVCVRESPDLASEYPA